MIMRLLLTNDDGLDCEGLRILAEELAEEHEVFIVAPDKNRSAVSHGITMNTPFSAYTNVSSFALNLSM